MGSFRIYVEARKAKIFGQLMRFRSACGAFAFLIGGYNCADFPGNIFPKRTKELSKVSTHMRPGDQLS